MEPFLFSNLLNTLKDKERINEKSPLAANETFAHSKAQTTEKPHFSKVQNQTQLLETLRPQIPDIEKLFKFVDGIDFTEKNTKNTEKNTKNKVSDEQVKKATKSKSTVPPESIDKQAMNPKSFVGLLNALDEQSIPKNQLYLIELAAFRNRFTSEQVMQLIEKLKFSRHKLRILKVLRHRIIDPENHFFLLKVFTHSLDKKRASALLKNEEEDNEEL
jgi:hypothetical protein